MFSLQDKHSFALPVYGSDVHLISEPDHLSDVQWTEDSVILGEGSNTIFTADFAGQLILNRLMGHQIEKEPAGYEVTLAAGENWHYWVETLVRQGIAGLENLALIPGSVGATPVQNIGAYGVEVAQFIRSVRGVDLSSQQPFELLADECRFGYRDSVFKQPGYQSYFITDVTFFFPHAWKPCLDYPDLSGLPSDSSAEQIFEQVVEVRQRKLPDPKVLPNAGSFFKNPIVERTTLRRLLQRHPDLRYFEVDENKVKLAAAWLIDQTGLKSLRVGGAGVHQRQALVLVNAREASGQDVIDLAVQVRKQVYQRFGVTLEPEVRLLNSQGSVVL
ncbi:UDP-N-acetylenolpyruvoylglucosamine reductase [Aliidiomarina sedimenti]|uniref:UDP-N-acetylenolpyruvoylglucosamine reductase n=1 Tax=Aliidiomarina sedimenti TaxID=1933879 RepID=A0ABY0BXB1_9GAMM|nr:UDP-N-acetylmuramate dehydrogenase [Aliidiomarina sedimenti]RUO29034.1 UDP-N-acetylenolpyruvoylglucosamine reductase [Aliidiomarina sedimenti]